MFILLRIEGRGRSAYPMSRERALFGEGGNTNSNLHGAKKA